MIVRKNISIDQCYVDKLKPFLEKNNGNLSAAIRDAIETASLALDKKPVKTEKKTQVELRNMQNSEIK